MMFAPSNILSLGLSIVIIVNTPIVAEDTETKFLERGELIFKADFEDGKNPSKPTWMLRNSRWEIENGVLRGVNLDGNGPFIRLYSKETGGLLPQDYILSFSFMIKDRPDVSENLKKKLDPKRSIGHRFSFGHYAASFGWRADQGFVLGIGHGQALVDDRFHIDKGVWYHVTAEVRANEILVSFKDGPTYYIQHNHFKVRPQGFEFFTHEAEVGYLDNVRVWSLAGSECKGWEKRKVEIAQEKRSFLESEHPDFKTEKGEKTDPTVKRAE